MRKVVLMLILIMGAGAVLVCAGQMGSESIVMDGGRPGQVTLPHWKHQASLNDNCNACHKLFPQEKQVIDKMKADGSLKKKEVMNNCIDCHRKTAAQSKPSGPISCKACHIK